MSITEAEVFVQAVDNAGFLWCQRDGAARDPRYDLMGLAELDERLAAQLELLRRGGAGALQMSAAAAAEGGAGEVFAALSLALVRRDQGDIARWIARGAEEPAIARGVVSAIGWAAPGLVVKDVLPALLDARAPPVLRAVGIAASAAQRRDPGPALREALSAGEVRLRARALKALGELGFVEGLEQTRPALGAEDAAVRFWAAWSAALLGEARGVDVLLEIASGSGAFAEHAAGVALRRLGPRAGARWLERLEGSPGALRVVTVGVGALGDPALVPWLIERMSAPGLARLAGRALASITGVDLAKEELEGVPLEETGPSDDAEDEDVGPDPDDGLPWPDAAAVGRWWVRQQGDFAAGRRYLAGREVGLEGLNEVLRRGRQPVRAAAAIERCFLRPRLGVFEVRARGGRQRTELGIPNT
ncbi:TIGR02270 family protein [Sorangium sp. So ce375]|uniref:TIGR02270 family protein n=1 Tax=Sorangium sp. So ce375 TaxID=3133306 RepID=UPI003F5C7182